MTKTWIQVPTTADDELNIGQQIGCRLINVDKLDELVLNVACTGKTGSIMAEKDGERVMLCNADSEVVTDIWMRLVRSLGVETIDFSESNRHFPVNYRFPDADGDDVKTLLNTFLIMTDATETDRELEIYERLILSALIGYLCSEVPSRDQNFNELNKLVKAYEIREYDVTFKNPVDLLFEDLMKKDPHSTAVFEYKRFAQVAPGKRKRVLKMCDKRLEILGYEARPDEEQEDSDSWNGCSNWNE